MYNIYHNTKVGKRMLIAEMDNDHLSNTIKMFCRHINTGKEMLKGTFTKNKFDQALFPGHNHLDEEDIQDLINTRTQQLQPYLGEACLRGLNFTELLQETFDRTGKVSYPDSHEIGLLLDGPENDDSEYTDVFEEI